MKKPKLNKMEYPLLHVYLQASPRQVVKIVANTEGLIALATALFEATSVVGKGSTELFCTDAEAYEVQVVRDDSDNAWESLELPYAALKSSNH